ncbi:exodeoxyribonuclease VII large subunit [Spiroplasma endosymbiont of Labia minor]|uniref:exodeoxyribonuclease VII large subunit n=1 Tax=Spiroplasma endosymbiont of Labia minor TaxID=3066305 RepID=UPI0030D2DC08
MQNKYVLSVSELNNNLKRIIEDNDSFINITVQGEIDNLVFNRSGHVYFTLKDINSSINCAMWKSNSHQLININAKSGMKITATGKIGFYLPTGKITFDVAKIQLDGIGELEIIFNKRKEELMVKGWFDKSIKKEIPKFPNNIGIITSQTGAAIHDIQTTIQRRYPIANIFIFPTVVQGEQAQFDIAKKIKQANMFPTKMDILIVGRGGGSYEDLWSFNELIVLEAIRNSNIPIISAIGHEPDVTLTDFVADKRAATPTAAGELSTPNIKELKTNLLEYKKQLIKELKNKVDNYKNKVDTLSKTLKFLIDKKILINEQKNNKLKSDFIKIELKKENDMNLFLEKNKNLMKGIILNKINDIDRKINNNEIFIKANINNKIVFFTNYLEKLEIKLSMSDPTLPLQKGYALIKNREEHIIRSIKNLNTKNIKIKFNDGEINATIDKE